MAHRGNANKGDLSSLNKVWETKELLNFTKSIEAKAILDRVARTVTPVMLRRRWKVLMLKEFYPQQDGLLGMNVNRGETILLRLRPPGNKNEFYPWEHTIGTMIHELTHMEIGPHNSDFYKLMDEIADEVDRDQISSLGGGNVSSISVGTFQGQGQKLGGREVLNGRDRFTKAQAVAQATQIRLDRTKLTSGSGQRLGGPDRPMSREELRQQAALAAERRMRDDLACRHGQGQSMKPTQITPGCNSNGRQHSSSSSSFAGGERLSGSLSVSDSVWICSLCDTANEVASSSCSFCSSLRNDACYIVTLDANVPASRAFDNSLCKPCSGSGSGAIGSTKVSGDPSDMVVDLTDSPIPKAKQLKTSITLPSATSGKAPINSSNPTAAVRAATTTAESRPRTVNTHSASGSAYPVHHMRS